MEKCKYSGDNDFPACETCTDGASNCMLLELKDLRADNGELKKELDTLKTEHEYWLNLYYDAGAPF